MYDQQKTMSRIEAGIGMQSTLSPDRGEVSCAMDDLEKAICGMVDDLRALNQRIEPALSGPANEKDPPHPVRGYSSQLAQAISARTDMVNSLSRAIRDLVGRVQL